MYFIASSSQRWNSWKCISCLLYINGTNISWFNKALKVLPVMRNWLLQIHLKDLIVIINDLFFRERAIIFPCRLLKRSLFHTKVDLNVPLDWEYKWTCRSGLDRFQLRKWQHPKKLKKKFSQYLIHIKVLWREFYKSTAVISIKKERRTWG